LGCRSNALAFLPVVGLDDFPPPSVGAVGVGAAGAEAEAAAVVAVGVEMTLFAFAQKSFLAAGLCSLFAFFSSSAATSVILIGLAG
jgi:hypothetical protein